MEDGAPRRGGKEEPPLGREVEFFLGGVLPVVLPVVLTAGVGRRTLGREVGVFLGGWDGGLLGGRWRSSLRESEVLRPDP